MQGSSPWSPISLNQSHISVSLSFTHCSHPRHLGNFVKFGLPHTVSRALSFSPDTQHQTCFQSFRTFQIRWHSAHLLGAEIQAVGPSSCRMPAPHAHPEILAPARLCGDKREDPRLLPTFAECPGDELKESLGEFHQAQLASLGAAAHGDSVGWEGQAMLAVPREEGEGAPELAACSGRPWSFLHWGHRSCTASSQPQAGHNAGSPHTAPPLTAVVHAVCQPRGETLGSFARARGGVSSEAGKGQGVKGSSRARRRLEEQELRVC